MGRHPRGGFAESWEAVMEIHGERVPTHGIVSNEQVGCCWWFRSVDQGEVISDHRGDITSGRLQQAKAVVVSSAIRSLIC